MRYLAIAATAATITIVAGCGGATTTTTVTVGSTEAASKPDVKLEISAPSDGAEIQQHTIIFRGTVSPPTAAVTIDDDDIDVDSNGRFVERIPLELGDNDVLVHATDDGSDDEQTITVTRKRTDAEQAAYEQRQRERREREEAARERRAAERREAAERAEAKRQAELAADNYPAQIRSNFIAGCTINASESECMCALERIEARLSLQQYLIADELAGNTGLLPPRVQAQFDACIGH